MSDINAQNKIKFEYFKYFFIQLTFGEDLKSLIERKPYKIRTAILNF